MRKPKFAVAAECSFVEANQELLKGIQYMARDPEGNLCIFLLIRVTCVLLFIVGVGVLADGIYACIQTHSFDYYTGGVLIFGVVILLLSTLGYLNRSNTCLLLLFLTVLFLVFIALTLLAIVMIVDKKIVKKVGGETNANYLRYSLLCSAVVAMIAVLLTCCYRSSLLIAVSKARKKEEAATRDLDDRKKPILQDEPTHWWNRKKQEAPMANVTYLDEAEKSTPVMPNDNKKKQQLIEPALPAQRTNSKAKFPE